MPSFTATTDLIPIQERGFFQYTESHYKDDGTGHTPLSSSTLSAARTGTSTINGFTFPGMTVVFRYYFMEDLRDSDTVDQTFLTRVTNDLIAVRASGCKVILRFAYTDQSSDDVPLARMLTHINQIAAVVNVYADIVHAIQAGFIGRWGEWYYTNNFGDSGTLSTQNIADRNTVITRLLAQFDPSIFILLRYVGTRQTYLGSTDPNPGGSATRLGLHNDAFLAPYGDYGTYTTFTSQSESFNRTYVENMLNVPNGGESAQYASPDSDWANASNMLSSKHFGFLNPNYYSQTLSSWGQQNLDTVTRNIGARLSLFSTSGPTTVTAGGSSTFTITIANDGWAAPVRQRPINLIFDDTVGTTYSRPLTGDIRLITPGTSGSFATSFTAPPKNGTYNLYLTLPDSASAIASRPEYMLRLANAGIYDSSTGRHAIGTMQVSGATGGSAALSGSGALTTTGTATFTPIIARTGTMALTGAGSLSATGTVPSAVTLGKFTKLYVNGRYVIVKLV